MIDKLPFVSALRQVVVGRAARPIGPPVLHMESLADEPPRSMAIEPGYLEYRTSVEMGYHQIGPADAGDKIRADTVAGLTHHLYGDINRELIEITLDLKRAGADPRSLDRLENLIKVTRPF